jgi:hypothetical protein
MSVTSGRHGSLGRASAQVTGAGRDAAFSPLMEALARLGYGVRGLVYITMGLLALGVASGGGSAPADQQGAIEAIGRQPAGLVLLWVVLVGLVGYALWGLVRAVWDPLHKGHDLKGVLTRIGYVVSSASYALLVMPTYGYIKDAGRPPQSGAQTQQSVASIMSKPWGPPAIGVLGLVIVAVGLYQVYQGLNASFDKQFETYAMTAQQLRWATQLGRLGTATRGLILALVGGALCLAGLQANPRQAIGIDAALTTLRHQPYGVWLLGIAALGLMAFGAFSLLSAAWFRLKR